VDFDTVSGLAAAGFVECAAAAAATPVTCRTKRINARFLPDSGQESCISIQ